jgi:transcriptional regulator with XRE-family HTH domain
MSNKHLTYDSAPCTKYIQATAYNLKKFRLEKKMTQMRLADKLTKFLDQRYSYQQIQKYESLDKKKNNKIPLLVGYAFSKILNKPLESFFISKEEQDNAIIFSGQLKPKEDIING